MSEYHTAYESGRTGATFAFASPIAPRNTLLSLLTPADTALLAPHLARVPLSAGHVLESCDDPIEYIYFPESGVVSVAAVRPCGRRIEVGLIGREGFCGASLLLGADRTPLESCVVVSGTAFRLPSGSLARLCPPGHGLRPLMLRYIQAYTVQSAQTALSHGTDVIEARLARWILMCHDRMDGDQAPLTHKLLSAALGVRRSGVTHALHLLEGRRTIRATRGSITVIDRAGLEAAAGHSYGAPEREFERLMGVPFP